MQKKHGPGNVLIFDLCTMSHMNALRLTGVSTNSTSEPPGCLPTISVETQPVSRKRVLT
jgi:hypothetical protein